MLPELGHFALILALFTALAQAVIPLIGAARNDRVWMQTAPPATFALFLLVGISFFALMGCYVTSDFSVLNVVQNSHTDKPMLYKIAGLWSNHEGSMLLWVFILAIYGLAVSLLGGNLPPALRARALGVQGLIAFAFILFILLTSNPFARVDPAPLNGEGLNPLLQDPGLAFHPPFLYLGYVGFSMAFSFAIAALLEGRVDAAWARRVRPWVLIAWCFLTYGIAGGSWWAYYTLGWGGWWYWDPVENASFMPWLAGTALLHSLIVVERRDTLKAWSILLTIIAFSFSLLGTFLVRSGALTSVHSFATDPARGVFILVLLTIVTGGSLTLFAIRAPQLKSGGLFAPLSREGFLLLNNVFLSTAAGAILLGTLYPLFMDVLDLGKISVGPPFFNIVFIPLMVPVIAAMAVAPMLSWKRGDLAAALARLKFAAGAALAVIALTWLVAGGSPNTIWASAALGLAAWLFFGTLTELISRVRPPRGASSGWLPRALALPRSFYGMTLAHAGVALVVIGITGSTAWKTEKIQIMHPGDTVNVAGYDLTLDKVEENVPGPNYTATRATFSASRRGAFIAELHPEKRMFEVPPRPTTDAAIRTNLLGDIYAVIGDPDGKGGYITRLYYNPLVPWIFLGAGVMALGGFVSLTDRRFRIGVARKNPLVAETVKAGASSQ
jgi:cytochrome c-type biogenesis protein CcmF